MIRRNAPYQHVSTKPIQNIDTPSSQHPSINTYAAIANKVRAHAGRSRASLSIARRTNTPKATKTPRIANPRMTNAFDFSPASGGQREIAQTQFGTIAKMLAKKQVGDLSRRIVASLSVFR